MEEAMKRWLPCRELVALLDDYLAGRLPREQASRFDDHLSRCPPCVAYMQTYRATIAVGRAALDRSEGPGGVPEELVRAILAARA